MTRLAFLDIETTGLDPVWNEVLEVAYVRQEGRRGLAVCEHFSLPIDEEFAADSALRINRYWERKDELRQIEISKPQAEEKLMNDLRGHVIVGNNPYFDLQFLSFFLRFRQPWHYHPVDLKSLVAGYYSLGEPPRNTELIAREIGVQLPSDAHTAKADAEWNQKVYWEIMADD